MKFGWIGIALACAVGCGALTSDPRFWTTSTQESVEERETPLGFDPTKVLYRSDVVDSMKVLLWPKATTKLKDGPWDGLYRPLSQAQIDYLVEFWKARKEPYHYEDDVWDCDNFALEFYYLTHVWNMRTDSFIIPPVPAVGIALIHVDGIYPLFNGNDHEVFNHAINVILRDDGQWLFFEPQNGKMLPIENMIYGGDVETIRIIL